MMFTRTRKILTVVVLVVGIVLLLYGLVFRSLTVLDGPPLDDSPASDTGVVKQVKTLVLSEPEVVLDVTMDGVIRRGSGQIQRTYGDNVNLTDNKKNGDDKNPVGRKKPLSPKKPAQFCST